MRIQTRSAKGTIIVKTSARDVAEEGQGTSKKGMDLEEEGKWPATSPVGVWGRDITDQEEASG